MSTCFSDPGSDPSHAKPLINLLRGWPNAALLPVDLLKKAANTVLSDPSLAQPGLFYGPDPGAPQLREAIAPWLTSFYQSSQQADRPSRPITPDRVAITGGASQNLGCLLQVFTDPLYTRNVWIVSPAYMLAFRIFDDAGLHKKLRAVPEDEEGLDVEFLQNALQNSEHELGKGKVDVPTLKPDRPYSKIYRHIIYAVPTFSNPSSKTMSLTRRQSLVRLAREFDALIVTDDVYDFLQWPSKTDSNSTMDMDHAVLPRIVDIDRSLDGGPERPGADGFGNAASNGSFSKIAGPGLRVGWVEGTSRLAYGVSQTGTTTSGGAPSQLTSLYLAHLLETAELKEHICSVLRPAYASRWRTLISAVEQHLIPLGVQLPQSNRDVVGGYFIWLTLPSPLEAKAVAQRAKEAENLIVAAGAIFEVPGDDAPQNRFARDIRLCFAWEEENKILEGVERLATVIKGMTGEDSSKKAANDSSSDEAKGYW